jgi:hypothetical protein
MDRDTSPRTGLRNVGFFDILSILKDVILPTLGKGVIVRRPWVVALSERLGLDEKAVERMQSLRAKYGSGPIVIKSLGRRTAILLDPDHVNRVLEGTPEPFTPATTEKRAALSHLEPGVSLIAKGASREISRSFNGRLLEEECPVHKLADNFMRIVDEEADALIARVEAREGGDRGVPERGVMDWGPFNIAWHRIFRRVVLGDGARDDDEVTDMLAKLRGAGNWAFLHPGRKQLRRDFFERLNAHLARAEEGSLAGLIAKMPGADQAQPADQVAHYFFAFDPGGMATFRTLALVLSHPEALEKVRAEMKQASEGSKHLTFLRGCYLDCLRLWPTTPAILRETTEDTDWGGEVMPKNTNILIFAPFFHRDDQNLDYAHKFSPEIWQDSAKKVDWPLVPFSGGSGICPARHLVPMLGSAMIASLLQARQIEALASAMLDPLQPMPGLLDNYSLRFSLSGSSGG